MTGSHVRRAVRVFALFVHAGVVVIIFFSGLVAHPVLVVVGMLAWGLGVYLMARWKERPARVISVPAIIGGAYVVALLLGDRVGLVGA